MRQCQDLKRPWLCQSAAVLDAQFFQIKPVERLLVHGMRTEYFNDDALGRALDAICVYDAETLYGPSWRHKRCDAWVFLGMLVTWTVSVTMSMESITASRNRQNE